MGHGLHTQYTVAIASGATASSALNLGRAFASAYLLVPSMTSNSQIHIQASQTLTGTYRRITHPSINSSTVGTNDFAIASSSTNRCVPIPNGIQFLKIETTATVDSGQSFTLITSDY